MESDAHPGLVTVLDRRAESRSLTAALLERRGHGVRTVTAGPALLDALSPEVDALLLEAGLPEAASLIPRCLERHPHLSVVALMRDDPEAVTEALRAGAHGFLSEPLTEPGLASVQRHVELARQRRQSLLRDLDSGDGDARILGAHARVVALREQIERVAAARATCLVHGETGTGKELVAEALHRASSRRDGPFVRLNCAALSESLIESELFGHEAGAFTGALRRRIGRLEAAHGGTLFLDEVSEVPLSVQVKLLRFLQERQLERVGGNEPIAVDVRIVAASNRDLRGLIERGELREDLFYRLAVVELEVPALRQRASDIPLLADHFLARYAKENGRAIDGFTEAARDRMRTYAWPGNVRELQHEVERAVVLARSALLDVDALGARLGGGAAPEVDLAGRTMDEIERIAIEQTLAAVGGSPTAAAAVLGISRRKIHYRLRQWRGQ